jgi:D-apiose dehydrogenase
MQVSNAALKVAMVGCGFFAQNHLHAWRDLAAEGADLAAVCDTDAAKAEAAAKKFGTRAFTSLPEMLDRVKPDLVDIATRMDTHRAICAELAERRIPAIVQKPLAPTWTDCVAMAETAKQKNSFLAIHENFRFQAPMLIVKSLLDEGAIGQPSWARMAFRTGYDVYSNQPYFYGEERLVILDVGIHVLDLARVFFGEVTRVACETQKRNPRVRAEDTASMLLRHESGVVSQVECTYEARREPDPFPHTRLEIEGERGALILDSDDRILLNDGKKLREIKVDNPLAPWMERPWHVVQRSVLETNRQILKSLQAGKPAPTDIEDNLKTYGLVEAAYAAAADHASHAPPRWQG